MKASKRFLIAVISIALILTAIPVSFAQTDGEADSVVLLQEDFETSSSASEYGTLSLIAAERKSTTNGNGTAIKMVPNGRDNKMLGFTLNSPITQGTIYIGYDYYREQPGYSLDIYTASSEQTATFGDAMGIRFEDGVLGVMRSLDWDNWGDIKYSNKVQEGQWHRVETWLDFDARIADFYIDGVQFASTDIGNELPCFAGWGRSSRYGAKKSGAEYIDNLMISHIKKHNAKTVVNGASSSPMHWKSLATLNVSTEVLGGTFLDEKAKVLVSAKSVLSDGVSGKLTLKATDDTGTVVCNESRDIIIEVGAEKQEEFLFNLPRYGFYDIYACFENSEYTNEGYLRSEAEYTIVRAKKSEVQNLKLGYSAHSTWGHGLTEIDRWYELLSELGFKLARDPLYWNDFQPLSGDPMKLSDRQQLVLEAAKKSNISNFIQFASAPGSHTVNVLPESPEELKAYSDIVYELIKQAQEINPDAKYIELYNEYQGYDPKLATAMQKAGYEAAKAADPDIVVVGGVTARFPLEWMESILKEGFGNYIDAFSGHPYTIEARPEDITYKHGTSPQQIRAARDLLDKYGCQDVEIILSELSYTASDACETEVDQAKYGLRQYIMCSPLVEEYIWYNALNKKGNGTSTATEGNFGLLKSWANEDGVLYQAKPVALAFGAYNDILAQGECLGRVETTDEDIYIYKFKTRNNEDAIAVWNWLDETETIGLSLGTNTAELYDMYGNKTDIVADANGVFNIAISGEVTYIKGNIDKVELASSSFIQPYTEIDVCMGESYSIPLNLSSVEGAEVEVTADDNFNITRADFGNLEFTVGFDAPKNSAIMVKVKKDGRVLYSFKIVTKYVDPIIYQGAIKAYDTERYMWEINISNKRKSDVSATLTINEPESLAGKTFTINKIVGGHTRKIRVNIPIKDSNANIATLSGKIDVISKDGAQTVPFGLSEYIGCFKYTQKSPVIDGKIDTGEWDTYLPIRMNNGEKVENMTWDGTSDLSAEVYTMIDDDFMYIGAVVHDDVMYDKDTPQRVWNNDSIQFAVATEKKTGARTSEFGLGNSNGEVTLQQYTSQSINDGVVGTEFDKETEYAVQRYESEKKTVYELKIKLSDVYDVVPDARNLKNIVFAFCLNDHDGDSRGWMEYSQGGIAGTKSAALYANLPVYGN